MPISRNAPMQKNASAGAKVLPIARISIRNTGMLRTTAEASGRVVLACNRQCDCVAMKVKGRMQAKTKVQ